MKGTAAAASASSCATALPPLMLVRKRLGDVRRHREVEAVHHRHERGTLPLLQARIVGEFVPDRRSLAALVVVRREDPAAPDRASARDRTGCRTARSDRRSAGRCGRSPPKSSVSPVNSRSSTSRHIESAVWPGVCSTCSRSLPTAIISPSPTRMSTKGAGLGPMHDHRDAQLSRELPGRGEVIGMGVRVDQVVDAQPVARGEREVVVDLAELRIDQRRHAGVRAADEVRLAAAGGYLFEDHSATPRFVGSAGASQFRAPGRCARTQRPAPRFSPSPWPSSRPRRPRSDSAPRRLRARRRRSAGGCCTG